MRNDGDRRASGNIVLIVGLYFAIGARALACRAAVEGLGSLSGELADLASAFAGRATRPDQGIVVVRVVENGSTT
jgi:hypothetical protein